MAQDRIMLTVPARGEYAKTVRLTAASLVSRMGMSFDDVEDVRMAAEEAFVYAIDTCGAEEDVTFEFTVDSDEFGILVRLGTDIDPTDDEMERRTSYATFILDSVCDRFDLSSDENGVATLRLVKLARRVDAD